MRDFGTVTTPVDDFTEKLSVHVPFAPKFMKERAVREALSDFFEKTRSWRETVTDVPLYGGDMWVDVNDLARHVSANALALAVDHVVMTDDKAPLTRLEIEEMDRRVSGWLAETADEPTGYMLYADRRMRVYPAMAEDADEVLIDVELVLTCDTDIDVIPDYVWQFHREAIVNGAAWRLLSQQGMPWAEENKAAFFAAFGAAEILEGNMERAKRAVDAENDRGRRRFFR